MRFYSFPEEYIIHNGSMETYDVLLTPMFIEEKQANFQWPIKVGFIEKHEERLEREKTLHAFMTVINFIQWTCITTTIRKQNIYIFQILKNHFHISRPIYHQIPQKG